MRTEWASRIVVVVLLLSLVLCFSSQPACGVDLYKPFKLLAQPFEAAHREKPKTGKDCSIEQLANQIDWLEHYIDKYGTIVAKHPDVWGESRLMRHRYEYEEQMAAQLNQFEVRMNAALRRSDQSFLGMAFALQAAAGDDPSSPGTPLAPPTTSGADTNLQIVQGLISSPTDATKPQGDAAVISRNPLFQTEKDLGGFTYEKKDLSLEPTIQLDQMSRYLNHLHELRRINEGDDIADSPGYALNLVRIPVSVLPGRQTRKGYGAEITITAEPYLSDELLPTTFRNLVINDVVDQLAYPMTRVLNSFDEESKEQLKMLYYHHARVSSQPELLDLSPEQAAELFLESSDVLLRVMLANHILSAGNTAVAGIAIADLSTTVIGADSGGQTVDVDSIRNAMVQGYDSASADSASADSASADSGRGWEPFGKRLMERKFAASRVEARSDSPSSNLERFEQVGSQLPSLERELAKAEEMLNEAFLKARTMVVPTTRSRRARMPLPPSQVFDVHDPMLLAHVAADVFAGSHKVNPNRLHLMDVRMSLQEELQAAYEYLSRPTRLHLWDQCVPSLAVAIRSHNIRQINAIRSGFIRSQGVTPGIAGLADGNTTRALAWSILVQASLLNERLIQDIKEATVSKGCSGCLADVEGLDFYQPQPSDLARMAFNEYVKCRWPIRVFALDPVTQDQNVADAFARRRELQVAAAVAFASGQMRAQALTRFTRRLEWDMATIALNRTVVAFSHGNDTFGWRFQPRFQTPPTPGTLQAFGETLLGGPTRDADMCQRELESGLRECTAIVVMPSFVPFATFDVRTNWYKLTDPKCTEMSMRETMELSRAITSMRSSAAQCAQCAHLYREGEVARMLRRVDQLDRELPLQTMRVQIPHENTSGGFEIFNRGITELAPELIGWYGAPGVDLQNPTTMFLVGDGFSVHDTRVIAGGRVVPFQLISRQLMQVEIPTGLQVLQRGRSEVGGEFNPASLEEIVDVHLATPYGVSSHLLVPVASAGAAPAGVHFEMGRGAEFELTFTVPETVDSFFRFNQETLVIRAPRLAEISDKTTVTFYVRVAGSETYLGTFGIEEVPLRSYTYEYRLTGDQLSTLVTKLNERVKPYLALQKSKGPHKVEVIARLPNDVPVAGKFTAVYSGKEKATE